MYDIVLPRDGTLVDGYFYGLDPVGEDSFYGVESQPGWLVSLRIPDEEQLFRTTRRKYLSGESCTRDGSDWHADAAEYKCSQSSKHLTRWVWKKPIVELQDGPKYTDFIPLPDSGVATLMTELLRNRIIEQKYSGLSTVEVEIRGSVQPPAGQKIFALNFLGTPCLRPMRLVSDVPNECHFCHAGPLLCPECGNIMWKCDRCNECPAQPASPPVTTQKGVRHVQPPRERGPNIIEGHLWDGSDFISGGWMFAGRGIVTRRVIDWLLSIHATPFVAEPVAVDTSKMTSDQLQRLEVIRRPGR